MNQQSNDKVKLMIDSGSQSTACSVDFAKGYATDDTERAKLWDIQDQKIEAPIQRDSCSSQHQGGCVRCREKRCFDGHTCWMENEGMKTTISEDSPTSEAPLYSLDVEVLPPPGEICKSKPAAGARIAPIAVDEERVEEGNRVELAGLVRDIGLNGKRGICMGRAPDGERWLIALPGGRRVNVKMSGHGSCPQRGHERGSTERP